MTDIRDFFVHIYVLIAPQVEKHNLPEEDMSRRFPQIQGFHYVSSFKGEVRYLWSPSVIGASAFTLLEEVLTTKTLLSV